MNSNRSIAQVFDELIGRCVVVVAARIRKMQDAVGARMKPGTGWVRPRLDAVLERPRAPLASGAVVGIALLAMGAFWTPDEVRATAAPAPCPHALRALAESGQQLTSLRSAQAGDESVVPAAYLISAAAAAPAAGTKAVIGPDDAPKRRLTAPGSTVESGSPAQTDSVVQAVSKVLIELDVPQLDIVFDGQGTLRVAGYMPSMAEWLEIERLLLRDIPSVQRVDGTQLEFLSSRMEQLNQHLASVQLDDTLNIVGVNGQVRVEGRLSEAQAP